MQDVNETVAVVVEMKPTGDPWYYPGNPTVGDYLVAFSLLLGALTWLVNSFKDRRQREGILDHEKKDLKWKRATFLFKQARLFDTDPDISEAVKIVTGYNDGVSIKDLLGSTGESGEGKIRKERHQLDKMLNLMERLSYAFKNDLLTLTELHHFGWYFDKVISDDLLYGYCKDFYPDILDVAKKLSDDYSK